MDLFCRYHEYIVFLVSAHLLSSDIDWVVQRSEVSDDLCYSTFPALWLDSAAGWALVIVKAYFLVHQIERKIKVTFWPMKLRRQKLTI